MTLSNFWFSENGDYIYSKNLNVYRTTSSTESNDIFDADINSIDKINTENESYYGLQYIYHSNNNLWILQNNSYSSEESTSIYEIEDNDYTLVKEYYYDRFYQPNEETSPFCISANYVFVNKEGTEITVLCKGISNNSWVIQFLAVK
ncbi:MAG: hypothetical protein IMY72_00490 [Bacteroidetes bacterium]|nr:hypothetical protein [Bacteroidota bacterium]